MKYYSKLELISYIGYNYLFLSFCKDVKMVIRKFKIKYLIFIIEIRDYDFVLKQSFLNLIKFSQKYKSDKIFSIIIHLYIY